MTVKGSENDEMVERAWDLEMDGIRGKGRPKISWEYYDEERKAVRLGYTVKILMNKLFKSLNNLGLTGDLI